MGTVKKNGRKKAEPKENARKTVKAEAVETRAEQPQAAAEQPDAAQQKQNADAQALFDLLYGRTAKSKVSGLKWLRMHLPDTMDEESLMALLASVGTESVPEALKTVAKVPMKKDTYYYDSAIMTAHFAELDAMIEEKDILHTIATVTRNDCRLYPRPTQFSKMMDYPFRFTRDEVEGAAARMQLSDEYRDIGVVEASNGAKAFFSALHMKRGYAAGLLEDIEVNEKLYP